ncbi:MAG: cytochrome c biogenesis protein CcsA [Bacteroidales bacterium]|nr:cytochrome c biogenesis protein CcsA [Bacteroidales bacterium]
MTEKTLRITAWSALGAVTLAMVAATFVERFHGSDAALEYIYHNPLFFLFWAVLLIAGGALLLFQRLQKRPFTFGIHLSFAIILAGALVTHIFSREGEMTIREGETAAVISQKDGTALSLPFELRLNKFTVVADPVSGSPADFRSDVTVIDGGETEYAISMNHILKWRQWRFYQADYDLEQSTSTLYASRDPWGNAITYAGYMLLLVSLTGFFFEKKSGFRRAFGESEGWAKAIMLAIVLIACAATFFVIRGYILKQSSLPPVLRTYLLPVHVGSMVISYTILGGAALTSLAGIVICKDPVREKLGNISLAVLYPGIFFLTFGIFIGAVWANVSWGGYWGWDPKETWALITLMVYSLTLHGSSLKIFRKPLFFHIYTVAALLSVLVTWLGVSYFLGGMHAYM